jgi:hypothetical protein
MNLKEYNHVVGSAAADFLETGLEQGMLFPWSILKMNRMYTLPVNEHATLDNLYKPDHTVEKPTSRMLGFLKTLKQEMDEGQEIYLAMLLLEEMKEDSTLWGQCEESKLTALLTQFPPKVSIDEARKTAKKIIAWIDDVGHGYTEVQRLERFILVSLADWLGDMNVYNRSEALKYGIPLESVLACIMGSNFTKLDDEGNPVIGENGKIQKGPNFVPPEEHIYATLFGVDDLWVALDQATADQANLVAISGEVINNTTMASIFDTELEDMDELEDDEDEGEF